MPDPHDRIIDELMEQLVEQGPGGMAAVFTRLFNLAMRFERENYLSARHYERTDERRGYANGIKPKRIDTEAGTLVVDVPKTAGTDEPFYPRSLERGTRSSRALMLAVAEQVLDPAQDLNLYFLIGGTSWTDFGLPAATDFIKQGYVLVATDYQGLGGGGKHQYAVTATNGRDLINSARAVGSMGLSGGSKKVAFYGWSQGGGAVLAAASSTAYITQKKTAFDDMEIVGAVSMGPDAVGGLIPKEAMTDPAAASKTWEGIKATFADNIFNFSHLAMNAWASEGTFPGLKMTDILTADGAKLINSIQSTKCMHPGSDTLSFNIGSTYTALFNPQSTNVQAWIKAIYDGSTPADKPIAPVQIYWGDKDTVMPPIQSEVYQKQKCAIGGNVQRIKLPGQSHFTTPGTAQPMFTQWIKDRFDGKPVADGCKA